MRLFTFLLFLAAQAVVVPAHAQEAAGRGETFRLTMPLVRATFVAYAEMLELAASDAAFAEKYKSAHRTLKDTNGRDTMGMTAAKLMPTEPRVAAIFRKAGVTPEQTTSTFETLVGVMFGEAMLKSANADESKLPAFVKANLAFYRENKGEIEGAFKVFAEKTKAVGAGVLKDAEDEEEDEEEEEK